MSRKHTRKSVVNSVSWVMLLAGCLLFACQRAEPTTTIEPKPKPESVLPTPQAQTFASPLESPLSQPQGKIAFHSEREGSLQIYVLHVDTGKTERLTTDPYGAFEPSWSPDCQSIVFTSKRDNPNSFEIYTMRSDGSEQTRLFSHQPEDDWAAAWSPTGDTIAYQTNPMGMLNVCWVSTGGEQQGCIEGDYHKAMPAWSPDGSKLLFTSDRDGDWEIFVSSAQEGATPVQLTNNDFADQHPQFSPDGQFIAFASKRGESHHIFVMNADGSGEKQLTFDGVDNLTPRWVGNERIVFASLRALPDTSQDWELFLVDRDGGNATQLTNSPGMDKWPAWCPTE
jgi:Tol biopolymer transport system component